ncbi:MAG: sulfur carrier protein ThiS [Opitutae bacterium]|nr:sulfur carrier protein ThiS [Opitutae bacterium]
MTITVNDKVTTLLEPVSLFELLDHLKLANRNGVAVAVNQEVVPRRIRRECQLADGDGVMVIEATQGG